MSKHLQGHGGPAPGLDGVRLLDSLGRGSLTWEGQGAAEQQSSIAPDEVARCCPSWLGYVIETGSLSSSRVLR